MLHDFGHALDGDYFVGGIVICVGGVLQLERLAAGLLAVSLLDHVFVRVSQDELRPAPWKRVVAHRQRNIGASKSRRERDPFGQPRLAR